MFTFQCVFVLTCIVFDVAKDFGTAAKVGPHVTLSSMRSMVYGFPINGLS